MKLNLEINYIIPATRNGYGGLWNECTVNAGKMYYDIPENDLRTPMTIFPSNKKSPANCCQKFIKENKNIIVLNSKCVQIKLHPKSFCLTPNIQKDKDKIIITKNNPLIIMKSEFSKTILYKFTVFDNEKIQIKIL